MYSSTCTQNRINGLPDACKKVSLSYYRRFRAKPRRSIRTRHKSWSVFHIDATFNTMMMIIIIIIDVECVLKKKNATAQRYNIQRRSLSRTDSGGRYEKSRERTGGRRRARKGLFSENIEIVLGFGLYFLGRKQSDDRPYRDANCSQTVRFDRSNYIL